MSNRKYSIALVVPALALGGGVPTVASFLYRVMYESGRYSPEIISLATSARDETSVRFLSPSTWLKGVRLTTGVWQGLPYSHVGSFMAEVEFQRYRSRKFLTELLGRYDLVQVVAGTPAWMLAAQDYEGPIALQVATLTATERRANVGQGQWWEICWRRLMTKVATGMEGPALQRADAIFVENRWMYQHLNREASPGKVIFAPPGVDTDHFHPTKYQQDGFILSVGRFSDRRKNVKLLFEAYHRFTQSRRRVPDLVLVGKAPAGRDLAYAAQLGILDRLRVYEDVSPRELAGLYRQASIFALASDEEGLGVVILEAMASGLPVVSTRCGGPETSVVDGENGYLSPVGDAGALAEALERLHVDARLRSKMARASRQAAVERFSLPVTGGVFLNRYEGLLSGRRQSASASR